MKLPRIFLLLLLAFLQECAIQTKALEAWPPLPGPASADLLSTALADYKKYAYDWRRMIRPGPYARSGSYLNWSAWSDNPATWIPLIKPDEHGILTVTYDGGATFYYNPTTIALHAFYLHSAHLRGQPLDPGFKADADFLMQMQGEDGGLRYAYALQPLAPGWVSGQAQGHAISVWTRAYKLFGDTRYLDASRKSYQFMIQDTQAGGCLYTLADLDPSLSGYKILTEVPFVPNAYVIDGSIFALLGVYDWTEFDPEAMPVFNNLLETIRRIIPYYDLGNFSTYDLEHVINHSDPAMVPLFHSIVTGLVWMLNSISPDPVLDHTWRAWAADVNQPAPEPPQIEISPTGSGRATITVKDPGLDEPIRLERTASLTADKWTPLRLLPPKVISLQVDTPSSGAFFRASRGFPIIDQTTLDGGFEIWNNPSDLVIWYANTNGGGTINLESSDVHSGGYSCRIDTASGPAGIMRPAAIMPGGHYFLEFWAKSSTPTDLTVAFGNTFGPRQAIPLDTHWTRYTLESGASTIVDNLLFYIAGTGVSVYLDDIRLWQFDSL